MGILPFQYLKSNALEGQRFNLQAYAALDNHLIKNVCRYAHLRTVIVGKDIKAAFSTGNIPGDMT